MLSEKMADKKALKDGETNGRNLRGLISTEEDALIVNRPDEIASGKPADVVNFPRGRRRRE